MKTAIMTTLIEQDWESLKHLADEKTPKLKASAALRTGIKEVIYNPELVSNIIAMKLRAAPDDRPTRTSSVSLEVKDIEDLDNLGKKIGISRAGMIQHVLTGILIGHIQPWKAA